MQRPRLQLTCNRCNEPLGETDGRKLYIGRIRFQHTITFRCECGERRQWTPAPLDLVVVPCAAETVAVLVSEPMPA
jgi:hypothetical protein